MASYAVSIAPQHARYNDALVALDQEDRTFQVYRRTGALEEHIAYATGKREDVQAFYAAQVPGRISLRTLDIQPVTPRMARQAIDTSVRRMLGESLDTTITGRPH